MISHKIRAGVKHSLFIIVGLLLSFSQVFAQDTVRYQAQGVLIQSSAFRFDSVFSATTRVNLSQTQQLSSRNTQLEDFLRFVPGVIASDRQNLSVGERFSIRGSGWQSAFGVRGVQVFYEDLPLTTLDGQTMMELIDPQRVTDINVFKGASSAYFGNSSGGAIQFRGDFQNGSMISAKYGAYNTGSLSGLWTDISKSGNAVQISNSITAQSGYRNHSEAVLYRLGIHQKKEIGNQVLSMQAYTIISPEMNNPGSLTRSQFDENPRLANAFNVAQNAGKQLIHSAFQVKIEDHDVWSVRLFTHLRSMENPLSYAWIGLKRVYSGAKWDYTIHRDLSEFMFFGDVGFQHDDRKNFVNNAGYKGDLTLSQQEQIKNIGLGFSLKKFLGNQWRSEFTTRLDANEYQLNDFFFDDGEQSGNRLFMIPAISLVLFKEMGKWTWNNSVRTSYDLPTTTELVNRVDGLSGFNPNLKPELNYQFETGISTRNTVYQSNLSLFFTKVKQVKMGSESILQPGRTVYENSSSGIFWGSEFSGRAVISNTEFRWVLNSIFSQFDDDSGSFEVPGLPTINGLFASSYITDSFVLSAESQFQSSQWLNQSNSDKNKAWIVFHAQVDYQFKRATAFVRIHNLLDTSYASSVSINANGGRYFDPAMERSVWTGVRFKL